MTETLIYPVLNNNGTDGDDLLKELNAAVNAVDQAISRLNDLTVHGRDFQTVPGGTEMFNQYRAQHVERARALRTVYNELITVRYNVYSQLPAKEVKA